MHLRLKRTVIRLMLSIVLLIGMYSVSAETQLYFCNVGKGDAIIIRTGDYTCLIDAGKKSAKESVCSAFERFGINKLDAVYLSHTDHDHSGGLKWLKSFTIDAVYTSGFDTVTGKHPADKLADKLGLECIRLRAGDEIAIGSNGSVLRVLAPLYEYPDNEDDNSLVMMLDTPDGKVLLTGDMEMDETADLLASDQSLVCDILKVPNHGDSDACPYELISASEARYAIISTNSEEKPGTPSPRVLEDLKSLDCTFYVTQDFTNGILVRLDKGTVSIIGD